MDVEPGERILIHLPLFAFCILVCIIGVLGNCLILHIFTHKIRVPVYGFFLKTMAVLDLVNSMYTVPTVIVFKILPNIPVIPLCEYLSYVNHFSTLTTGMIYIAIAMLRYQKVCHPRGYQMTKSTAKNVTAGCITVSFLVSIPIVFLITKVDMYLPWKSNKVTVPTCDYHTEHKTSKLAIIFAAWIFVELSVITGTLVVLYGLIRRTIKHIGNVSVQTAAQRQVKPPPVFLTLAIVYFITCTPMAFLCIFYSFVTIDPNTSYILLTLLDLSVYLPFINCLVNPVVYSFSWKKFRREYKKLFTRKKTNPKETMTQQTPV